MVDRKRPPHDDELRAMLKSRGLRVTHKRMLVLRELAKQRMPASHPELTERLAGSTLNRVTIYRTLHSLTAVGLLIKTQLGDRVWRFNLLTASSTQHADHPHFVCSDCGAVACLPSSSVALSGEAVRNNVLEVQLRGRCLACTRSSKRSTRARRDERATRKVRSSGARMRGVQSQTV